MKASKGKLIRTRFVLADGSAPCYTCRFHDYDKLTPASEVRVREYEKVTEKTFFCAPHAIGAREREVTA